jgi:hypothetical protein
MSRVTRRQRDGSLSRFLRGSSVSSGRADHQSVRELDAPLHQRTYPVGGIMKVRAHSGKPARLVVLLAAMATAMATATVVRATSAEAAATPTLTLKVVKGDDVKVAWQYTALASRDGSVIEIERSVNGAPYTKLKSVSRPRPSSSFADKDVPSGTLSYHARLVVNGVAQPYGAVSSITVGGPTTSTTTTSRPATTTTTTIPTPGNPIDWGRGMAVPTWSIDSHIAAGPDGSVYFAGTFNFTIDLGTDALGHGNRFESRGSNYQSDVVVAKYTNDGKLAWARQFGDGEDDRSFGIAVGEDGNVYLTGRYRKSITFGATTLQNPDFSPTTWVNGTYLAKLSPAGAPIWAKKLVAREPVALAANQHGEIAFIGWDIGANNLPRTFVARFTSTGTQLARENLDNWGNVVAIDTNGVVAVAGEARNETLFQDIFVQQFDPQLHPQWGGTFGGAGSEFVEGIAIDPMTHNVAVTGSFVGYTDANGVHKDTLNFGGPTGVLTTTGIRNSYVGVFSSAGSPRWSKSFDGHFNEPKSLAYDPTTGDLIVALDPNGSSGAAVKLRGSSGAQLWQRSFASTYSVALHGIATGPSGAVFLSGHDIGSPYFYQPSIPGITHVFVVKMQP